MAHARVSLCHSRLAALLRPEATSTGFQQLGP